MVVPCLGALCYFVWFKDSLTARFLYGATKVFTLAWPVVATLALLRAPWPRLARTWLSLCAAGEGALSGLVIMAVVLGAMQTPLREVVAAGTPAMRAKAEAFGILDHYWAFALLLSTAHALLEEYYWRWFVFGRLRERLPVAGAHLLAAAAFASHHVVITGVYFGFGWGLLLGGMVGVGGAMWSVLYQRHGTLLGAWISHVGADLAILSVGHKLLFGTWI
jgi:membrane protease YdiL (CAAX protease family)